MPIYRECIGCIHDGGQNAYGSYCEHCKRNPTFDDNYENPRNPGELAKLMINFALHYTSAYNMKEVRVDVEEPNNFGPIFKVILTAKTGSGQKVGASIDINMHDIARNAPGGIPGVRQAIEYRIRQVAEKLLRVYREEESR